MKEAQQLTQDEAFEVLARLRILEQTPAPPQKAIQIVVSHGPEESYLFTMTRDPVLPGLDTLDAWRMVGPMKARTLVASTLQNLISRRYQQ